MVFVLSLPANKNAVGRKRRQLPILENIEILDIGSEGKSIAKSPEDKVIFVTHAVPGDIVDLQVAKSRNKFLEAYPVKYHKYSDDRQDPVCEHFGVCGGCRWQHLPYEKQLFYKEKQVLDNLKRIGKVELKGVSPILGSEKTTHYRNKLEYTFSANRWFTQDEINSGEEIAEARGLGFHIPKFWDKILDINECHLQPHPSNEIRLEVRKFAFENDLSFFHLRNQEGLLRNLIIRTSSTGEVMVIVVFFYESKNERESLLNHLKNKFPEITSLMYIVNEKKNDSIIDQDVLLFAGKDHMFEEMEGLQFKISGKSFYQTNSAQAYELYKIARKYAQLKKSDTVYDLYTGTGTIANFIAKECSKVLGLEYVPEAIEDAKINSEINGIKNTSFIAGDLKDLLTDQLITEQGVPDVVITDPPRAGMHEDVVHKLLTVAPKRIVYISCNPATQARDINLLSEKYTLTRVQPVDMFPHTYHIENVVLLELTDL